MGGLKRLEYRGYDSSWIAGRNVGNLEVIKKAGRLDNLNSALNGSPFDPGFGIGHTRWATHREPSDPNARPHVGGTSVSSAMPVWGKG